MNTPYNPEAVEAAMAFVQDIGQVKASPEWVEAIEVIAKLAPDTATAYTVARILAAEVVRLRGELEQAGCDMMEAIERASAYNDTDL